MNAEIFLLIARALFGKGRSVSSGRDYMELDMNRIRSQSVERFRSMSVPMGPRAQGELRPNIRAIGNEPISSPILSGRSVVGSTGIKRGPGSTNLFR